MQAYLQMFACYYLQKHQNIYYIYSYLKKRAHIKFIVFPAHVIFTEHVYLNISKYDTHTSYIFVV